MKGERISDRLERLKGLALKSFVETFIFGEIETAGTIRVMDVFSDGNEFPGFDVVLLDFGGLSSKDYSPVVYRVPMGLAKENQIVEVLVKRDRFFGVPPDSCLVAIRPFERQKYGKTLGYIEANIRDMFIYNSKTSDSSPNFFKKFPREKVRGL